MGAFYLLFTLNDEIAGWLVEIGLPYPTPLPESRFPTLGELKAVVKQLDGCRTTVTSSSMNTVDFEVVDQRGYDAGWSTTIWGRTLSDEARKPHDDDRVEFSFHKGNPELAVIIIEKLTHVCGPLLLVSDADCRPLLVVPGLDPIKAVEEWLNE